MKYDGRKSYRAILLNEGDKSFVKVAFDEHSSEFFKNNLSKIGDVLARASIWKTLFEKVKDGEIKFEYYLTEFVFKFAASEDETAILSYIFESNLIQGVNSFVPIEKRSALKRKIFYFLQFLLVTV